MSLQHIFFGTNSIFSEKHEKKKKLFYVSLNHGGQDIRALLGVIFSFKNRFVSRVEFVCYQGSPHLGENGVGGRRV